MWYWHLHMIASNPELLYFFSPQISFYLCLLTFSRASEALSEFTLFQLSLPCQLQNKWRITVLFLRSSRHHPMYRTVIEIKLQGVSCVWVWHYRSWQYGFRVLCVNVFCLAITVTDMPTQHTARSSYRHSGKSVWSQQDWRASHGKIQQIEESCFHYLRFFLMVKLCLSLTFFCRNVNKRKKHAACNDLMVRISTEWVRCCRDWEE